MTEGTPGDSPTIKKRRLSDILVAKREALGMTKSQVAKRLRWSEGKITYIERRKWIRPDPRDVEDLCELYQVDQREREAMVELAEQARERGWWRRYNDVFRDDFAGLEAGASLIRTFETTLIPGLLQVPSYIELVTRSSGITESKDVERHVAARTERQRILSRQESPTRLDAVIDEAAILRIADPTIRTEQLKHIVGMARRRNIQVQILRIADGLYAGAGEVFTYLEFPDDADRDIVYLETAIDDRMLEEPDELARYRTRFEKLRDAAISPTATVAHLREQMGEQ